MATGKPKAAIVGAGMGGLATAAALYRAGFDITVYEQARQFRRIGAGIQMTPNAVKALRGLGLEEPLRAVAFQAREGLNRDSRTGEVTNRIELGDKIIAQCGAPLLTMHRGDLHDVLASAVPDHVIRREHKLAAVQQFDDKVHMRFENGLQADVDLLIAADGVHSVVREAMLGMERPRFTGRVAYRATFPASFVKGVTIDERCKWWGPDRHIVIYYTTRARDEIYFVTSTPEKDFTQESWSMQGDLAELREAYREFHPIVRGVLDACPEANKWALCVRDPLPRWVDGRIALLGDACHPMTPYMAQGAASAIEDAVVLSRCLEDVANDQIPGALLRYEASRKPRASEIQQCSAENNWMQTKTEFEWVYGFDPWTAPLA